MRDPTARQLDVLAAIERLTAEKGYAPNIPELAAALGMRSKSTVHWHLHNLAREGLVAFEPRSIRTLRVLRKAS